MSIALKYQCPNCKTPLGYQGLCWKCKAEQTRREVQAWTPEQIAEKQQSILQNLRALEDMEDPEFTDFWNLLSYHHGITPEMQRKALTAEVFYPSEIYYHAPEDVRDGLISALLHTDDANEAANLMSCLAMQGDDQALAAPVSYTHLDVYKRQKQEFTYCTERKL